jgi:hypothetical protein
MSARRTSSAMRDVAANNAREMLDQSRLALATHRARHLWQLRQLWSAHWQGPAAAFRVQLVCHVQAARGTAITSAAALGRSSDGDGAFWSLSSLLPG